MGYLGGVSITWVAVVVLGTGLIVGLGLVGERFGWKEPGAWEERHGLPLLRRWHRSKEKGKQVSGIGPDFVVGRDGIARRPHPTDGAGADSSG